MSIQTVTAANVKHTPKLKCYFLQIPPELRNEIYELAFTSDDDPGGTDLYKKVPPSPSLALACSQIWQEASAVFSHSWKRYWSERRFVIPDVQVGGFDQASQLWAKVSAALPRDSALASVTKLRLTNIGASTNSTNIGASKKSSIIFDQGKWTVSREARRGLRVVRSEFVFAAKDLRLWAADMPQEIRDLTWYLRRDMNETVWRLLDTGRLDEETLGLVQRHALAGYLTRHELLGALRYLGPALTRETSQYQDSWVAC